nr:MULTISPECIES: hypothetical protein [Burkholderia]
MSISVGTGGGCLLSGLLFGWLRTRHRLSASCLRPPRSF